MSTLMKFELAPHSLQFLTGGSYPGQRTYQVLQVKDRTAGGTLKVADLGIQIRTRVIDFNMMCKSEYDDLIDWFLNVVNGGMLAFDFTDEYGDTSEVRIVDDTINFSETSLYRYSGSITVEYQ